MTTQGDGRLPNTETWWLIERKVSPPQYITTGNDLSDDAWRALRFKTERDAHDYWRTMRSPFRDECTVIEHMFINKPDKQPSTQGDGHTAGRIAEYAWVIEHRNSPVCEPLYWAGNEWSRDNLRAIRFCRKEDAERTANGFDEDDPLPNEGEHRICEHGWVDKRASAATSMPAFEGHTAVRAVENHRWEIEDANGVFLARCQGQEIAAQFIRAVNAMPAFEAEAWSTDFTKAPKNEPLLVEHRHESDPYHEPNGSRLTEYGAWCEGLGTMEDGFYVAVWGGGYHDQPHEGPEEIMPDWWFVSGFDFEKPLAPVRWKRITRAALAASGGGK